MDIQEFQKKLINIQNETVETKILQAILITAEESQKIAKAVSVIQNKINEMIVEINDLKERVEELSQKETTEIEVIDKEEK